MEGITFIKVKPSGNMVLIRHMDLPEKVGMIHMPSDYNSGEALRRCEVVAVGVDVQSFKTGDKAYHLTGTGQFVEFQCHKHRPECRKPGGAFFLCPESALWAKIDYVEDGEGSDVVPGLTLEAIGHNIAEAKEKAEARKRELDAAGGAPELWTPGQRLVR